MKKKKLWTEIVRRFDDVDVQVALVEKIYLGKLDEGYLSWNGRC